MSGSATATIVELAVDFANTTKHAGADELELLREPQDLVTWAAQETGRVPEIEAGAVRLGEIRTFRDDVKALLRAVVDGVAAPVPAAERVNARLRAAPLVLQPGRWPRAGLDGHRPPGRRLRR